MFALCAEIRSAASANLFLHYADTFWQMNKLSKEFKKTINFEDDLVTTVDPFFKISTHSYSRRKRIFTCQETLGQKGTGTS